MMDDKFKEGFSKYVGMVIDFIVLAEENGCTFHLRTPEDAEEMWNGPMTIFDGGQSCCETRWMTCDDDLSQFKEAKLTGFEYLDCSTSSEDEYEHDCGFLRIDTSAGSFRICMHNRHNGYYAGFSPFIKAD